MGLFDAISELVSNKETQEEKRKRLEKKMQSAQENVVSSIASRKSRIDQAIEDAQK